MKYLKLFNNDTEHQQFIDGEDYIEPHIVCVKNGNNKSVLAFKKKEIKKENKLQFKSLNSMIETWEFQYPVNSDLIILYDSDSKDNRIDIPKNKKEVKFGVSPLYSDELGFIFKSFTPSEDDKYIYVFDEESKK